MLILGVSSFKNDAAAALVRDGVVEAAIENVKLEPAASLPQRLPEAAIQFCLSKNTRWADVDAVAVASRPFRGWRRRAFSHLSFLPINPLPAVQQEGRELVRLAREWSCIRSLRQRTKDTKTVILLDHHLCHASSAFFLSPFDKALILTLDGEGDGRSGMIAVGEGNKIEMQQTISLSNSVGRAYSRVTAMLELTASKDEHKTQWMSLEGEPKYLPYFLRVLRKGNGISPVVSKRYSRLDLNGTIRLSEKFWNDLGLDRNQSQLAPQQKRDLAASLQAAVSEVIVDLVSAYQQKTGLQNLCLGGGVFHNTLLVSVLERKFGLGNVFVPPAPGNAGCALGAAGWIWHHDLRKPRDSPVRSVYWGPAFSRSEIKEVLDNVKARYFVQNTGEKKFESAIRLLKAGKIVGWYQGATEFGPRALGHRSILASPWTPYVTENLNDFVKHRESFRPFAVSVRAEDCARYFEASSLCCLMNSLGRVRPAADVLPRSLQLPGGLVRLHIVEKEVDPMLWELLGRFGETEPAPILVNTSFNLPGEAPVVRPKDAVRTFFCSGIDAVFVDNFLLTKPGSAHVVIDRAAQSSQLDG